MNMIGNVTKIIVILLIVSLLTLGCSGRGDWDYELINGYQLIRSNAHCIRLCCHYDLAEQWGNSMIVLDKFYVVAISISDTFVGLQGIPTKEEYASDIELDTHPEDYQYYLLDSINNVLYGPYNVDDYLDKCVQEGISGLSNWTWTKDLNSTNGRATT